MPVLVELGRMARKILSTNDQAPIKQSFTGVPLIKKAEDGEVVDMAEGEEEKRPMTLQGEVTMKSQNLQDPM